MSFDKSDRYLITAISFFLVSTSMLLDFAQSIAPSVFSFSITYILGAVIFLILALISKMHSIKLKKEKKANEKRICKKCNSPNTYLNKDKTIVCRVCSFMEKKDE